MCGTACPTSENADLLWWRRLFRLRLEFLHFLPVLFLIPFVEYADPRLDLSLSVFVLY